MKLLHFISGMIEYVKVSGGCSTFHMLNKLQWYLFITEDTKFIREDSV